MTPSSKQILKQRLIQDEKTVLKPYKDIYGNVTVGDGHNLTIRGQANSPEFKNGITLQKAYELLDEDIDWFLSQLAQYSWFNKQNDARQIVLVDMAFNMGLKNLLGFKKMLAALDDDNHEVASNEMLNSKWVIQVHHRAIEDAKIMLSGQLN